MIRIGDIRKAIEGLPDDAWVVAEAESVSSNLLELDFHDIQLDVNGIGNGEAGIFCFRIGVRSPCPECGDDPCECDDFDDEYIFEDDDDEDLD